MKNLFALLLIVFTFTACKKEKQIEKNLWKDGGTWNIDHYYFNQTGTDSSQNNTITLTNAGIITFNEDGTGKMEVGIGQQKEISTFDYSNTENSLTITTDNFPVAYEMDWKKNKISLNFNFTATTNGQNYGIINNMKLTKQ